MGLEGKTNEQAQDLLAPPPVAQEGLRQPAALDHDDPWVDAEEQEVRGPADSEAMAHG